VQPLSAKELGYLTDSMKNEDLLAKQCVIAVTHAQNPAVQQVCEQAAQQHLQHYNQLLDVLQQHANLNPAGIQ